MSSSSQGKSQAERAILYRDRARQCSVLADNETATCLKARYLQLATSWHDMAIVAEEAIVRDAKGLPGRNSH